MRITRAELTKTIYTPGQYEPFGLPEIAVVGRSNAGKSSLINRICNNSKLARVSSEPGKTRSVNFFTINQAFMLVDLPGYGYAKVTQEIREKWGKLIERYLHGSKRLKAVFLLIDIRHEPSENDKRMYEWIVWNGYDPIIIATKLDKIKRSQIQKQLKLIRTGLNVKPGTQILPFSAETKQGRDEIWALIDTLIAPETEPEEAPEQPEA